MISLIISLLFFSTSLVQPQARAQSLQGEPNLEIYSLWNQSPAPRPLPPGWRTAKISSAGSDIKPASKDHPQAVFVRLQLNMKPSSGLKDSLADLGHEAGFRPDNRFDPVFQQEKEKATVWGWLPSKGIGKAARIPAVEKISFSQNKDRNIPPGEKEELIIGLRVDTSISKTLSQDLPELIQKTGLRIEKTIGYQPVPRSDQIAILFLGKIPISNIAFLLNQPEVIKVLPLLSANSRHSAPLTAETPAPKPRAEKPLLIGLALGLVIGSFFSLAFRILNIKT